MAPPDTRQRMIDTAVRQFQRHGYHATSWRRLVNESATPWGSVQHHFPGGKEELALAAIEAGTAGVAALIRSCQEHSASPADAVQRLFRASAALLADSGYAEGCPIAPVALDTADSDGPVQAACAAGIASWTRQVREHLRAARMPPAAATELATTVIAGLEGSLLLAKLQRSTAPMLAVARQLGELIDQRVGTSDPPRRQRRESPVVR